MRTRPSATGRQYVTCHMESHCDVLPATRHKWTRRALIPASKPVLDLPTPEGWEAELTVAGSRWFTCHQSPIQVVTGPSVD